MLLDAVPCFQNSDDQTMVFVEQSDQVHRTRTEQQHLNIRTPLTVSFDMKARFEGGERSRVTPSNLENILVTCVLREVQRMKFGRLIHSREFSMRSGTRNSVRRRSSVSEKYHNTIIK